MNKIVSNSIIKKLLSSLTLFHFRNNKKKNCVRRSANAVKGITKENPGSVEIAWISKNYCIDNVSCFITFNHSPINYD